ncbi:hypothetical protein [Nocardioides marmoribigeumensis]|jgi:hypothetical protein|uniref:Uncharacterized protein n=1 Tax=Nocardioides marmoribigeumensis TaxID=433649 RepID=A0ABU2BXF1_9ACTN|nr:hypothetical protein [Nocardioides marmoribigeumensis]MDR7363073.1 hypothetical protein [Nocardioides marmoribigeumensis]
MNGNSSILYTMGMALGRAHDLGYDVSVLVDGQWLHGRIAAEDGTGLVLEQESAAHSVVRLERVSAVTIHAESPYHQEITGARPMPGPRAG